MFTERIVKQFPRAQLLRTTEPLLIQLKMKKINIFKFFSKPLNMKIKDIKNGTKIKKHREHIDVSSFI